MIEEFTKNYYDLLTGEYAGINLTRIVNYEEFETKQIQDSIQPYYQSEIFKQSIEKHGLHVDVGFGGGFPILPLARILPEINFVGVETRGKKAKVVGEIAEKLHLNNVSLIHERIENILIDKPCTISLKAVGKVYDFLSRINSTENVQVFFYKGPNFYEFEKEQIKMSENDWRIIEEKEIWLQGVEKRYIIGFENKKVLRGTENKKLKNLVKLSELL